MEDAITWFDRARALGDVSDEVRISLAEMRMVSGDLDRVAELVADPCSDASADRRRLMLTGERAMITGANEVAVETLTQALSVATSSGSAADACAAGELLSRALLEIGRFDEAVDVARGIIHAVDPGDHDTLARAIGAYGTVLIPMYDLRGAIDTLRRAVEEASQGEDRVRLVHLKSDLASAYAMSGDVASSLDSMLSAREVAAGIGYRRHLALSVSNEAELRLLVGDGAAVTALSLEGLHAAARLGDIGLACDNLLRLGANPGLSTADRRAIIGASVPLEETLGRPHTMIEFQAVSIEIAALEPGGASIADAREVLRDARDLERPDLELRILSALGSRADRPDAVDLASRLDEPGDRFLIDVELRRISGDHGADDELRARGRALYRTVPFLTYRAALEGLGVQDPPTDVVVPRMEAGPDDPIYSLRAVLTVIETLSN